MNRKGRKLPKYVDGTIELTPRVIGVLELDPSTKEDLTEGDFDDQLKDVETMIQLAVESCFHPNRDSGTAGLNLHSLIGLLAQFQLDRGE